VHSIDINKVIKQIYDEKTTEGDVDPLLFESASQTLQKGMVKGYGTAYDLTDAQMLLQLHNNVAVFSAFKSYRQTGEMAVNLLNEDGTKKSFSQFEKESKAIDDKYRNNWLKVEFDMATKQARAAERWQQFKRDQDVYPNLIYKASSSAEPRIDHTRFYGLVYPIDHPFWNTGMPPLAWGCKCSAEQTREDASNSEVEAPEAPRGISGNSGKTGMIFAPNHSYITGVSKADKEAIKKDLYQMKKGFDTTTFSVKGKKGKIDISFNADLEDLQSNFTTAKLLVDKYKETVLIRHHSGVKNVKNPEFEIQKRIGDKADCNSDNPTNWINRIFSKKITSKDAQLNGLDNFLILNFNGKLTKTNVGKIASKLNGSVRAAKFEFIILEQNNKVVKITKKDFEAKTIESLINKNIL
jgi:hypothetical protein